LAAGVDSVCENAALDLWPDGPLPQLWLPVPTETCVKLEPDTRIRAIVPIDGSNQVMHFYELSRITVPYIGIGEEWNILTGQIGPGFEYWHAREHAAIQITPSYRMDVSNAYHVTFTNVCETGFIYRDIGLITDDDLAWWQAAFCSAPLPPSETRRLAAKYMIAFLKVQLVGDRSYQSMLTPGYALTQEQNIEFLVTEKRNPSVIDKESDFFNYFQHQPGSSQANAYKDAKQGPTFWRRALELPHR
jgi:hypothetical protein